MSEDDLEGEKLVAMGGYCTLSSLLTDEGCWSVSEDGRRGAVYAASRRRWFIYIIDFIAYYNNSNNNNTGSHQFLI